MVGFFNQFLCKISENNVLQKKNFFHSIEHFPVWISLNHQLLVFTLILFKIKKQFSHLFAAGCTVLVESAIWRCRACCTLHSFSVWRKVANALDCVCASMWARIVVAVVDVLGAWRRRWMPPIFAIGHFSSFIISTRYGVNAISVANDCN